MNLYGSYYMGVCKNNGTPKSSILIGFSIINHPFWDTPIFGNTHMDISFCMRLVSVNPESTVLGFATVNPVESKDLNFGLRTHSTSSAFLKMWSLWYGSWFGKGMAAPEMEMAL